MILLHTTKYGDSSLILHGFTRDAGRRSFIVRGVGKKRGSGSTALLHPLSILEVELRPGAEYSMGQIKDYTPKYPLHSLRSSVVKNTIAIYMSELLYRTLRDSEADPALYDFLESSIITLNSLEGKTPNFHLWFTIKYISLLGFMPNASSVENLEHFTPWQKGLLVRFLTVGIEDGMKIPLKGGERCEFIESMVRFLEHSLCQKIEIKSLNILHQVLL